MDFVKRHLPSPAMIVALLALFVAGTGTGIAASKLITGAEIKDGTIQSRDIRDNNVQSRDIKNGTVQVVDLSAAAAAALRGQKGDKGDTGAPGVPGVPGVPGTPGSVGPTEGVTSTQTANPVPATLTNSHSGSGAMTSTFTTTHAGKLFLTKYVNATITCGGADAWWYIILDGQPVRGTASRFAQTEAFKLLAGVTNTTVAPGAHTMTAGAQCASGSWGGNSESAISPGTAIVVG